MIGQYHACIVDNAQGTWVRTTNVSFYDVIGIEWSWSKDLEDRKSEKWLPQCLLLK